MVFVDLHLYTKESEKNEDVLFRKYASNINYIYFLSPDIKRIFIQHAGFEMDTTKEGVRFIVRNGPNNTGLYAMAKLFYQVKKNKPDVVLMHGFIHPVLPVLFKLINRRTKILIQNHAERPFNGPRKMLQKLAGWCVHGFLFTGKEQAKPWLKAGIIRRKDQIYEVMEGSTPFTKQNRIQAKQQLGYLNKKLFLWVGRLDVNKDPLTVLRAFRDYVIHNDDVKLCMIYSTNDLLKEIEIFIKDYHLANFVDLVGYVEHTELEKYYNASEYFILGSHYEGSGYALCEAMACGCVPVVTDIPSFRYMLHSGECGYLFEPGDAGHLLKVLLSLNAEDLDTKRKAVVTKFNQDLSFEGIGFKVSSIIKTICK